MGIEQGGELLQAVFLVAQLGTKTGRADDEDVVLSQAGLQSGFETPTLLGVQRGTFPQIETQFCAGIQLIDVLTAGTWTAVKREVQFC